MGGVRKNLVRLSKTTYEGVIMDLALKFRPKSFAEVIGQETVISILSRQIATRSWKNTYLFCGAHGCGKTTCARIFADRVNDGMGQPIEIDGASHNGVDDIRDLIADAQQSSIECDYKVYIIDECHMITNQGWNAALKLIEEPPTNAIFIFCTTNPEKLPQTILSRVQRFDFKRVSREAIADRLEFIMNEEEHKKYERAALDRIASLSDGHVRDAVKLLDKCLSNTDVVSMDNVEAILGLFKYDYLFGMVGGMFNRDIKQCLDEFSKVRSVNTDLTQFYNALLSFSIDCAIYARTGDTSYTEIPDSLKDRISCDKEKSMALVDRLMSYKKYLDPSNAEVFIKSVIIEMCEV